LLNSTHNSVLVFQFLFYFHPALLFLFFLSRIVSAIAIINKILPVILNQNPEFISSDVKMKFNIINIKLTIIKNKGKLCFFISLKFSFEHIPPMNGNVFVYGLLRVSSN
jgi:hypothetical protein